MTVYSRPIFWLLNLSLKKSQPNSSIIVHKSSLILVFIYRNAALELPKFDWSTAAADISLLEYPLLFSVAVICESLVRVWVESVPIISTASRISLNIYTTGKVVGHAAEICNFVVSCILNATLSYSWYILWIIPSLYSSNWWCCPLLLFFCLRASNWEKYLSCSAVSGMIITVFPRWQYDVFACLCSG